MHTQKVDIKGQTVRKLDWKQADGPDRFYYLSRPWFDTCTGEYGTGGRALVEVCTGMRMAGITRVSREIRRNGDRCCWMELGAAEIPHGRFRNFADDKHLGTSVRILGRS